MPRLSGLSVLLFTFALSAETPGVFVATHAKDLPLPSSGYQVYMIGEYHGLEENAAFQLEYLQILYKAGLRDVAIEEKSVYQQQAQAYVDGTSDSLTPALCLRAAILDGIRRLNADHRDAPVRIHLPDVDSPASAIREHLLALQKRIPGASSVAIPEASKIKTNGIEAADRLKQFHVDSGIASELRTIRHSIGAYQNGLEADTGRAKGSPYLEDREQAVASNIEDLIRIRKIPSLLVIYGSDHLSRTMRKDGGPNRDQQFAPLALRLQTSGISVYSVVTFPLSGKSFWRGQSGDMMWSAADGHLASGVTFDKLLAAKPAASLLYIETKREHATLPSQDISRYAVDAFLLFRSTTAMTNHCVN